MEAEYEISIIHNPDYTIEMIFEKQLYILLPFYLLRYENVYKRIQKIRVKLKEVPALSESLNPYVDMEDGNEKNMENTKIQDKLDRLDRKEEALANMLARDLESIYNELN